MNEDQIPRTHNQEAEATLGLRPADVDLIVAVREGDVPEIGRLLAICAGPVENS